MNYNTMTQKSDNPRTSNGVNQNQGQTLIETIMGIFILTTGLAAGLGLAIYAFGASSSIAEKIVGTGLAREGVESVRRMRDSNWLAGTLSDCGSGQQCYANWLSSPYNISGATGSGLEYRLVFNPLSQTNKWTLSLSSPSDNFRLYVEPQGGLSHIVSAESSNFFRKINIIYQDINPPYGPASPLVLVRSTVWWHERNCPTITYFVNPSDTTCKIITEELLTNWRNY